MAIKSSDKIKKEFAANLPLLSATFSAATLSPNMQKSGKPPSALRSGFIQHLHDPHLKGTIRNTISYECPHCHKHIYNEKDLDAIRSHIRSKQRI